MLCDDIIADDELPSMYDGLELVYAKIRRAQKFVLAREFAIAADGLVDNIPELRKIAPWCRTPYPLAWIEWAHHDRPHWDVDLNMGARPVDPSRHQLPLHRVGMLLEQEGDAGRFLVRLFWSMHGTEHLKSKHNASLLACRFTAANAVGKDPLVSAIERVSSDFGLALMGALMAADRSIATKLMEYAIEDWGGEVRFMVSMLGLLNTRNVVHMAPVDNEAMNVKRARHGKRPLFSHTLIKVRPSIVVREGGASDGGHRDLRLHFVRGHFKHRASGVYWWSMHTRGSIEQGMVSKDYEIAEEKHK